MGVTGGVRRGARDSCLEGVERQLFAAMVMNSTVLRCMSAEGVAEWVGTICSRFVLISFD